MSNTLPTSGIPSPIDSPPPMSFDSESTMNGNSTQMATDGHEHGALSHVNAGSPTDGYLAQMEIDLEANQIPAHPNDGLAQGIDANANIAGQLQSGNLSSHSTGLPRIPEMQPGKPKPKEPKISHFLPDNFPKKAYVDFLDAPTLHHLKDSQSQRIIWLLEELSVPYTLVAHERDKCFRAPASLAKSATDYGKAPFLVTRRKDGWNGRGMGIPESSAIASYLIRTYDYEDRFSLRRGVIRDEVLCSVQSSFYRAAANMLMVDFGDLVNGNHCPEFSQNMLNDSLKHLSRELGHNPDRPFFMGMHPGRADILIEWPMSMVYQRGWVNLEKEFPNLYVWLKTVYSRYAWRQAGNRGNGYDLTVLPTYIPETESGEGGQLVTGPQSNST